MKTYIQNYHMQCSKLRNHNVQIKNSKFICINKSYEMTSLFFLSVSPDSSHGLVVVSWVPIRVKHHQSISTYQVQTTPTSLATQHKDKVVTLWRMRVNEWGGGTQKEEELTAGSLNLSTIFCLFLIDMDPSSLTWGYRRSLHSLSNTSSVCV